MVVTNGSLPKRGDARLAFPSVGDLVPLSAPYWLIFIILSLGGVPVTHPVSVFAATAGVVRVGYAILMLKRRGRVYIQGSCVTVAAGSGVASFGAAQVKEFYFDSSSGVAILSPQWQPAMLFLHLRDGRILSIEQPYGLRAREWRARRLLSEYFVRYGAQSAAVGAEGGPPKWIG